MRKSRFTEAQIIGILNAAEAGAKVPDLAREHGVSTQAIYNWRAKYGGLVVNHKRVYRIYSELEPAVRRKRRKRAAGREVDERLLVPGRPQRRSEGRSRAARLRGGGRLLEAVAGARVRHRDARRA